MAAPQDMQSSLEEMWESNRQFVRRLLIGLSHDIDLADDLTQETYIRARAGMSGYRGGSARAWLAAIARNAFLGHVRRKYVTCESALESMADACGDSVTGEAGHLDLLEVRRAVAELAPTLRKALILKHYGGYTYDEIAERLACPVGTAKSRVSVAISRLRASLAGLREELATMKCKELTGRRMMDFVSRRLAETEAGALRRHFESCASCRSRMEDTRRVLSALDAVEVDHKAVAITELSERGGCTVYMTARFRNDSTEPWETLDGGGDVIDLSCVLIQQEEAEIETLPPEPGDSARRYKIRPRRPIQPGEIVEMVMVGEEASGTGAKRMEDGTWRFGPMVLELTEEMVYLAAVRLPAGARPLKADPPEQEIRTNGATTVIWRGVLPANERLECWLDYRLE